ncbi:MAG TPA: hypothetical protein VK473_12045 [Terriglobales bacterium]|nr:hypothetical protein [Terriglobales bacterium]
MAPSSSLAQPPNGAVMGKAQLVVVETFRGSIVRGKCPICGVGFAQRYLADPLDAERRMNEYFSQHVADRHSQASAEER